MPGTDFDVKIGDTWAKVQKTERGGYVRRSVRREIENNLLSQSENPAMISRADRPSLYQTSWAGGSRWYKPLITPADLASYFRSNHMDAWSEPGKLVPTNEVVDTDLSSVMHPNCVVGMGAGQAFFIGSTNTEDSATLDVYQLGVGSFHNGPSSGYTSGVDDGDDPIAMAYDATDLFFYVLSDGGEITRFKPSATVDSDAAWLTGLTFYRGSNIFVQNGSLLFYNGESIYTIDKAGPSATLRANDGRGPELLHSLSDGIFASGATFKLAVATPEGIYYVKNGEKGGSPEAWVMRVERDSAGNWMLHPIATLPPGNLALGITYHLGQIIVSATPDWLGSGTGVTPRVDFFYFGSGGAGVLGSPLGKDADEAPFTFLGSEGPYLYIAGTKRLWVYDGVRGGMHSMWEWPTASNYRAMFHGFTNQAGPLSTDYWLGFASGTRAAKSNYYISTVSGTYTRDDPDTVTNFGDDETHYTLISNFFDGGLPMEEKELTKIAILREAGDGDQEWTIQVSVDGGAFADVLVHSTSGETYAEATPASALVGRKFQYKAIYQTKDTNRNALEALLASFATGEVVTEWDLYLDGDELLNVDNEVQDEEEFYDALKVIAATNTSIELVDNYQEQHQESGDSSAVTVKVMAVEILKDKPGESAIRVLLRGA